MRYWVLAVTLVATYLLQSVVSTYLSIGGIVPDLLVVLVVSYGLLFGWEVGMGAGVLAGLLVDLTAARFIGSHVLSLGAVGLLAGLAEENVFKDNLLLAPVGGLLGSITSKLILMFCLVLFGWRFAPIESLRATILPGALYDMALTVIVYGRLYRYYLYLRPDPRGTIVLRRN